MRKWLLGGSILFNILLLVLFIVLIQSLGGFQYLWFKVNHRGVNGVYEHRKNLFELLPSDSNTIVFLGNSLTAQCEWSELFGLQNIRNRGIPGDMTTGVYDRLPEVMRLGPGKIFLMIGVNDLLFRSPEKVLENYELIIQKILSDGDPPELYLQSLLPVNNQVRNTSISNIEIKSVNQGLKGLSEKYQLPYLDLFSKFSDSEGRLAARFTRDGIHLNGEAYLIWKKAIEPFVLGN